LRRADQDGEAALGCQEGDGQGEGAVEFLDGSEGDDIGAGEFGGGAGGYGFGTFGDYIDVRQCKFAGDFAEESGFFMIRFNEREMDSGRPDFERESGKSGAGADVYGELRAASFELRALSSRLSPRRLGEVGVPRLRKNFTFREVLAPLGMTPLDL